ncbi:cupin [Alkalilimnicola ehrlichii]|uniref:Cupin n=1 Tax=Alkalilimnicola ehrlichii TaxID=351052 RepID=A0A3E0WHZ1_9GAMM|nr:cupin domain-containing protein [Alkalilimnicola ehrlichii]RFA29057.1 cupin [Alkalilimnicola ehrlichii]RFA31843.1 cupin [Alkalilimnicola ehrlichii]
MGDNASKIVRANNYRWNSVDLREYKTEGSHFKDITRQTLLGEGDGEQALNALTRYFEVQPGGYSTLEKHEHTHSVIIIRGAGEVILEDRVEPVGLHDCVYIAPNTFHQFHATSEEPLGFLCIVDRDRDRPQLPSEEDLERLRQTEAVASRLKA